MKKTIIVSSIMVMILFVVQIKAQKSPSDKVDHLKTELNLTDNQVAQLKLIFESKHEKMKALRSDDTKSKEEKQVAMKNFRQSFDQDIAVVLDKEQLAKFQEIKKAHRGEHGRKGHHGQFNCNESNALHTQIKAYREENIKPVMLKQRAKLEPKISKADKKLIAEMRTAFEKMRKEREARFDEMKKDPENKSNFNKTSRKGNKHFDEAKHEQMKALVEKYKADMEPLFAEVADQQQKWENDIREMKRQSLESKDGEKRNSVKHFHGNNSSRMEFMKMSRFLLLNPSEKVDKPDKQSLVTNISAFPNPASTASTIEYKVLETGLVLIELRDNKGKLLKTIKNENHAKGKYKVTISLEPYQSDLFYVVIQDKNGVTTTKDLVRVR